MTKSEWLFSFRGRIGRQHYWTWFAIYYIAMTALLFLGAQLPNPMLQSVFTLIVPFILVYPDLAVQARRWHDRNRSNYWLLLNIPVFAGRILLPAAGVEGAATTPLTPMENGIFLISTACSLWILVECGLLKGKPESNRYGSAVTPLTPKKGAKTQQKAPHNETLEKASVVKELAKDKVRSIFKK
ncbi:DUF805 domain-containing protein [Vibrio sp. SS-MA-C1-2]|uniref:DUF805 domain-containing protein n=1 Tax=Vibrio sp. SS-MA-C1-2 TaxID=2908646 RepID=UPI001F33CF0B|nr:DUF805 domain-containing protein [Vibrio sp. SS-MA-C1-2]UJF19421.1 DUF805 domain-containing protein [Vibrio sp. SS-MA-C1-2]